jgi:hypothetical protein
MANPGNPAGNALPISGVWRDFHVGVDARLDFQLLALAGKCASTPDERYGNVCTDCAGEKMKVESTTQTALQTQKIGMIALALSLAGFWVYFHWVEPIPFYDSYHYDPEMAYMMSSLSVFREYAYDDFYQHPGTPVQVLGTALLALTYPITIGSPDSFVMYHVRNPELFLSIARAFLTLGSIACVVLLARHAITTIEHWTDALFSIAVAATFYAVHPFWAFKSLVLWSHNSFNLPAGSLLLLGLLVTLRSGRRLRWWQVSALGFGAGVLTSIQLYFATWVIGTIVAVATLYLLQRRGWLQTTLACLNAGLASLFGFVTATLPVIKRYPEFFQWVQELLFHQGVYGSGAAGITSPEQFLKNIMLVWSRLRLLTIAVFLVIVLLGIAIFLQRRNRKRDLGLWAVACGLSVQLMVTMIIIFKHFLPVYMLAVAAILPLLLAIAFTLLRSSGPLARLLCVGVSVAVLLGFLYSLTNSVSSHRAMSSIIQSGEKEMERFFTDYAVATGQDRDSLTILWTYGTDSRCYALWYCNDYAKRALSKEISQVCPYQRQLNFWRQEQPPDDWDIIVAARTFLIDRPNSASYLTNCGETILSSQARTTRFGSVFFILPALSEESQAGLTEYLPITVDSSLTGTIDIDPHFQTPWGVRIGLIWLGHGEEQGLKGALWSTERQAVQVIFDVMPGPAREDSLRTFEVTLENEAGIQTERQQFDRATKLVFDMELQSGRNELSVKVLEETTILRQPNADTRPLLMLLRHITVNPGL